MMWLRKRKMRPDKMVSSHIVHELTIWMPNHLKSELQKVWYSNGWYSNLHCICILFVSSSIVFKICLRHHFVWSNPFDPSNPRDPMKREGNVCREKPGNYLSTLVVMSCVTKYSALFSQFRRVNWKSKKYTYVLVNLSNYCNMLWHIYANSCNLGGFRWWVRCPFV